MQAEICFQCDQPIHFSVSKTTLKCQTCGAINENIKNERSLISTKRKALKKVDDDLALIVGIGEGLSD